MKNICNMNSLTGFLQISSWVGKKFPLPITISDCGWRNNRPAVVSSSHVVLSLSYYYTLLNPSIKENNMSVLLTVFCPKLGLGVPVCVCGGGGALV